MEGVVHDAVGGCDCRPLLEGTGHFCAIVGLARSVRFGPLLGLAGSVCGFCVELVDFFNVSILDDIGFYLIWHLFWFMIWNLFGILCGFILWKLHEINVSVQLWFSM